MWVTKINGGFKLMHVLHFQIGSSNYLQLKLGGFHRIPCVNIALYKAILKMWYAHPKVDHTNEKQENFITTNYALKFKAIQIKKLMSERINLRIES